MCVAKSCSRRSRGPPLEQRLGLVRVLALDACLCRRWVRSTLHVTSRAQVSEAGTVRASSYRNRASHVYLAGLACPGTSGGYRAEVEVWGRDLSRAGQGGPPRLPR